MVNFKKSILFLIVDCRAAVGLKNYIKLPKLGLRFIKLMINGVCKNILKTKQKIPHWQPLNLAQSTNCIPP